MNLFSGLIGLIIFALDIWAIAHILRSDATTQAKILWTAFVAIFPVVGLAVWYFAGPRAVATP